MARRPLGPLLVVPQFEDMIDAPQTKISVPPEPVANQILQDRIFGHLSSMWNNIETSQELSLRHQTNCLLYTSPSPRDLSTSRMPSSA